jgi:hypothetical protein
MEMVCVPRLSLEQERKLPKDYVRPLVEGSCVIDEEHPKDLIIVYVSAHCVLNNRLKS